MPEELTVREAAEALGVSPRAVRDRLAAGMLQGEKVQGARGPEWRVILGEEGGEPATRRKSAKTRRRQGGEVAEVARLQAVIAGKDAVIAVLQEALASERQARADVAQLATRQTVLLQQVQGMLPAATETREDEAAGRGEKAAEKAASPPRSWWRWFLGRSAEE